VEDGRLERRQVEHNETMDDNIKVDIEETSGNMMGLFWLRTEPN
jgi:uncharacterized protein YuzE